MTPEKLFSSRWSHLVATTTFFALCSGCASTALYPMQHINQLNPPSAEHDTVEGRRIAVGESRGKAEGKALSLLTVLSARGLDITERHRDIILSCTDDNLFDQWLRRAVAIDSVEQLFD